MKKKLKTQKDLRVSNGKTQINQVNKQKSKSNSFLLHKKDNEKNDEFLLNRLTGQNLTTKNKKENEKNQRNHRVKKYNSYKRKSLKNFFKKHFNRLSTILVFEILFLIFFYLLIFFKAIQTPFFYDYDYVFLRFHQFSFITSYELGKTYAFIEPILAIPYSFGKNLIQEKIIHSLLIWLLILIILISFKNLFYQFVKIQNLIVTNYEVYSLIGLTIISILPFFYFFSYGNIFELYLTYFTILLFFSFVDFFITNNFSQLINFVFIWVILTLISAKYSLLLYVIFFFSIIFAYLLYNLVKKLDLGSFGTITPMFHRLLKFMFFTALALTFFILIIWKFNIILFPYLGLKIHFFKPVELNNFARYHLFGFLSLILIYIIFLRRLKFRFLFYFLSLLSLISYLAYLILPFAKFFPLMILTNISIVFFLIGILMILIGSEIKVKYGFELVFFFLLFFITLNYIFMIQNVFKFDALSKIPSEIISELDELRPMLVNKTILPLEWQNLIAYLIPGKYLVSDFGLFIPLKSNDLELMNKIIEKKEMSNVELFRAINVFNIDVIITLKDLNLNCLTKIVPKNNKEKNNKNTLKPKWIINVYDTSKCK